jgi:uncharacterized protein YbjT (DUF2867 family)
MIKPRILVTGATGKTGGAVVRQLLEQGWPVRALVHRRDARSERLDRLGAETVVADLYDPGRILAAMAGTKRAYYCPPIQPYMVQSALAFAVAAREARLESVVGLSQWLANPEHPALMTRQHWLADRLFASLHGVAHTVVNPGFFADEPYLSVIRYAAQLGLYPLAVDGSSRNAPPSVEDIARVSVAALLDPDRHAGKTYRPTGPRLLSVHEIVDILSRVLDRKVRHVRVPMWLMLKAVRFDGFSPFLASEFSHYLDDLGRGAFAFGGPTDDVLAVTGRQPEDFETVARRHAARPEAKRTLGNQLRALAAFMAVPFAPGVRPAHFERRMGFPRPTDPRLSSDSEQWRDEHRARPADRLPAQGGNRTFVNPGRISPDATNGAGRPGLSAASANGGAR